FMQCDAASADPSQRPVDSLLNKVSLVGGCAFNERKTLNKALVAGTFVVSGKAGKQSKRRAFDELLAIVAPLSDFRPRVRCPIEKVKAECVTDTPIVEVVAPAIHLRSCDLRGIVDERGQQPRLIPTGIPKQSGNVVTTAKTLAQRLNIRH